VTVSTREGKITKRRHDTGETHSVREATDGFRSGGEPALSLPNGGAAISAFRYRVAPQSAFRFQFTGPLGRRADRGVAFRNLLDLELSKKASKLMQNSPHRNRNSEIGDFVSEMLKV